MNTPNSPDIGPNVGQLPRTHAITDPRALALAERLLTAHPDLPSVFLSSSRAPDPEQPGEPDVIFHVQVDEHDTAAVAAWAATVGAGVQADGALRTLDTVIDGVGIWACAAIPEDAYDTEVFTPTRDDFATPLYDVPMIELGDEGGLLLGLGHIPPRRFLAAVNAWGRVTCGIRYVPTRRDWPCAADDPPLMPRHAWVCGEAYPTRSEPRFALCEDNTPGAAPVTYVHSDDLSIDYEDLAPLERCPACDRASRSTTSCSLPGRHDRIGPVHTCSGCGHRWPQAEHCKGQS